MAARIGGGRAAWWVGVALLALAMPAWAEAGRVSGRVVDRDGKAAAGATVWAANLYGGQPLDVRAATADDAGAFAIEAGTGHWIVFAARGREGGRIGWDEMPEVKEGNDPAPLTVRLGPPTILKGRLLDAETGGPIAGGTFVLDDGRRVEVDADGRFEAPGLALTNHEAYPVCPGYERRRILFDTTGRPEAELELTIPRGGKVVGRVADVEGKPIPGAVVGLRTSGTILSGAALWERCGDDGRFAYDGKPLGRSGRLTATAPGYQDREIQDIVMFDPAEPAEVKFTLRADPTRPATAKAEDKPSTPPPGRRNVSGTVVGPGGAPVAGALVRWDLRVSTDTIPETATDESGAFRLVGVPDAQNVLSVMAKGLAPGFPTVPAGGDREVNVELKPGAIIFGRVVDEAGAPIEGAKVVPLIANPKPNWAGTIYLDELETKTDREGRFRLEGVPEGVRCDVVADGMSAARKKELSVDDEAQNVVILAGVGAVRGRVVDPAGNPVRNFRVQVHIPKDAQPGEAVGGFFAGYQGTGLSFTRDDGAFTITGLTAGNLLRLRVIADGFGSGEVERIEARSLRRLGPEDAVTIRLALPTTLRVHVFRAGGAPVEGALVSVVDDRDAGQGGFQWGYSDSGWADTVTARADARGWAEFPFLPFDMGAVVVRAKGCARKRLGWTKDEPELDAFVEPAATLSGSVRDEAGRPVASAWLVLSWGPGESLNVAIDEADGRFRADGLPQGACSLSLLRDNGPAALGELVELKPGEAVVKDIRLKPANPDAPAGP